MSRSAIPAVNPTIVRQDPRVIAAMRKAMKAGGPRVLVLVENIEELAPAAVRAAFEELIATVVAVAAPPVPARISHTAKLVLREFLAGKVFVGAGANGHWEAADGNRVAGRVVKGPTLVGLAGHGLLERSSAGYSLVEAKREEAEAFLTRPPRYP